MTTTWLVYIRTHKGTHVTGMAEADTVTAAISAVAEKAFLPDGRHDVWLVEIEPEEGPDFILDSRSELKVIEA